MKLNSAWRVKLLRKVFLLFFLSCSCNWKNFAFQLHSLSFWSFQEMQWVQWAQKKLWIHRFLFKVVRIWLSLSSKKYNILKSERELSWNSREIFVDWKVCNFNWILAREMEKMNQNPFFLLSPSTGKFLSKSFRHSRFRTRQRNCHFNGWHEIQICDMKWSMKRYICHLYRCRSIFVVNRPTDRSTPCGFYFMPNIKEVTFRS